VKFTFHSWFRIHSRLHGMPGVSVPTIPCLGCIVCANGSLGQRDGGVLARWTRLGGNGTGLFGQRRRLQGGRSGHGKCMTMHDTKAVHCDEVRQAYPFCTF
jgi:hypothetical protein